MKAAMNQEIIMAVHKVFHTKMFITVLFIMAKNGRTLEVHPSAIRWVIQTVHWAAAIENKDKYKNIHRLLENIHYMPLRKTAGLKSMDSQIKYHKK